MSQTFLHVSTSNDATFHLALEEVFLKEGEGDLVLLYINSPCVVVGKHQNAYAETNSAWCKEHGIPVYRRLSGGGTVFHDEGNINFCFIRDMEAKDKMIDFARFLKPIQEFLGTKGIEAVFSGRNDLLVDGFKISGNAEHVHQKRTRVIHHGTILVHAALGSLNTAIHPSPKVKYNSKAVQSVRSKVRNLNHFFTEPVEASQLMSELGEWLSEKTGAATLNLDKYRDPIREVQAEKYSQHEWNYGYSPTYQAELQVSDEMTIFLDVKKGEITAARYTHSGVSVDIEPAIGKRHDGALLRQLAGMAEFEGTEFAKDPSAFL